MAKINVDDVVKSFFIGIVVGLVLTVVVQRPATVFDGVLNTLASGAVGLLIGLVTEVLTALLPIRIARTRTYFFVNNLIAIIVTTIVVLSLVAIAGGEAPTDFGWWPVVGVAVSIVCVANATDFLMYRRTQSRLRALQGSLANADRETDG